MANELDLSEAILHGVSPNELGFDQKRSTDGDVWDDPVKLRFGAYSPADGRHHFYLGTLGADVLSPNGPRREKVFLAFKMDNNDGEPALPCIEIYAQRTEHTTEDKDMLCICRISSKGIELDPKGAGGMAITGGGGGDKSINRMWSPDGLTFTQQQNDGNFVTYSTSVPFDIGANPVARWSAWTGFIE